MIVLISYIIKPFLDNKMSVFEEYGAFKFSKYEGNYGNRILYNII